MRGTIGGKGAVIMDAGARVNPAVEPAFEVDPNGSHTLQSRDSEGTRDPARQPHRGYGQGDRRRQCPPSTSIPVLLVNPHRY